MPPRLLNSDAAHCSPIANFITAVGECHKQMFVKLFITEFAVYALDVDVRDSLSGPHEL